MKRKSLISLLLVAAMTVSCVVGLMLHATAEGANKIVFAVGDLTVEELGVEGATYTTDIMGALSALDANSRKHSSDTTAEIHFKGSLTGGDQGNLLFAQKTIWRADGTKLPISIIGHDTAEPRDAYIYLDGIGGWYTCANDYSFKNLTLPVGDQVTYFYAGSGNIRLDNVNLTSAGDLTVETVAERTEYYQNALAAAEYIVADAANLITPDVERLPAGDAWQTVRHSTEYMATGTVKTDKNGAEYVDKDPTGADGSLYGDYSHSGNTGGGQYLNACVYYEAILGLECKDNSWRPTSYALDETLIPILQKAAHDAVLEVYGEDHFKNPPKYDIDENGTVNLLMIGSSSSYYMRDELHLMAKHIGIDLRVVHAYSSGIKMKTMWSWTENANGKWTVYTDYDATTKSVNDQKFTDFVADYPWDAIVTYETGGSFNKKNLKVAGYNEASIASSLAFIDKADEFINEIYNYNADNAKARYFWFQTISAPIGAPGPSSDAKGFVFGDNNTTAAYAGWTQEDLERHSENGKVVSSVTMGDGMNFGTRINAVGYMLTAPETPLTDETAAEVKFEELEGYENVPQVLPINTLGKLILDSDTAAIDMTPIKRGYSPASAELHIKKGSGGDVYVYGYNAKGLTKYGDITFRWTGGTVGQMDLLNGSNITGDLNVILDLPEGNELSVGMIRVAFNANVISGDVNVVARNVKSTSSVYSGGGAGGVVTNTFENCNITGDFFAVRSGKCGKIVNNFKDTTVGGVYCGGHWSGDATVVGPIVNNIDSLVLTGTKGDSTAGVYYGGSNTGGSKYTCKVTAGSIEVNGKNETLSIYNNIGSIKLTGTFYAGSRGGTATGVRSDITSIEGAAFYGAGGGSGTSGNATTNIKTAVLTGNFYGGSASSTANSVKNIATDIENLTLKGNFYGGNLKSTVSGNISNTLRGGKITGYCYGGNSNAAAKNITNEIYGGTFTQAFFGGGATCNANLITTTVHAGTFNANFYGGSEKGTSTGITNTVNGGTFLKNFAGAGYSGNVNGTITNNISGGTFVNFHGGFSGTTTGTFTVTGDILNTVKGDVVISKTFAGGTGEDDGSVLTRVEGTIVNVFDKNEKGEAPSVGDPDPSGAAFCYFGGGHHTHVACGIVNEIKAGSFRKIWLGGSMYQGYLEEDASYVAAAHTPEGVEKGKYSTINLFEGGTFESTKDGRNYVWGGTIGYNSNYKHGTLIGGVYTEVSGSPVFNMRLIGGFRGFAADATQPVKVKISGGTFNDDVFMLSSQLGTGVSGTIHTGDATITGGTFNKIVYGGSNGGGSATNATLTVQGGTFNDALIASSYPISGTEITGSFTLTLEPTATDIVLKKAVVAQNDAETIAIKGGDKKIQIDTDAGITADSYDGNALQLLMTENVTTGTVYLSVPTTSATDKVSFELAEGVVGTVEKIVGTEVTEWIGLEKKASVSAVNLILDDKIDLRLWLNKAEIDALPETFTYEISCEDRILATGTYAELKEKAEVKTLSVGGVDTEFYTLVIDGNEPASFHKKIRFGGAGLNEASYSLNDIFAIVINDEQSVFSEGFETLAKSLWNYGIEAYNRFSGETSSLEKKELSTPAEVEVIAKAENAEGGAAQIVGRALALREAVGIRYYLNLQDGVKAEDLTFTLNGVSLDAGLIQILEESGNGYNASVTLYVSAGAMDRSLTLSVYSGETLACSCTDSIASICQQYVNAEMADAALCTALLRYIQAVPGMNN